MTACLPAIKERLFPSHRNRAHIIEDIFEVLCASIYHEVRWKEAVLKTEDRSRDTGEKDIYIEQCYVCGILGYHKFLSLDRLSKFLRWQLPLLTKVICSKILIKDWLIIFIAVLFPQADQGGKQTAIYRVIFKLKASSDKPWLIYSIKHEKLLTAIVECIANELIGKGKQQRKINRRPVSYVGWAGAGGGWFKSRLHGPTLRVFKILRNKCSLCNNICKRLDFLVFTDKDDKPSRPVSQARRM